MAEWIPANSFTQLAAVMAPPAPQAALPFPGGNHASVGRTQIMQATPMRDTVPSLQQPAAKSGPVVETAVNQSGTLQVQRKGCRRTRVVESPDQYRRCFGAVQSTTIRSRVWSTGGKFRALAQHVFTDHPRRRIVSRTFRDGSRCGIGGGRSGIDGDVKIPDRKCLGSSFPDWFDIDRGFGLWNPVASSICIGVGVIFRTFPMSAPLREKRWDFFLFPCSAQSGSFLPFTTGRVTTISEFKWRRTPVRRWLPRAFLWPIVFLPCWVFRSSTFL